MIHATTVSTRDELQQILQLQRDNLAGNISTVEMNTEGFVTMQFSMPMLEKLHALAPGVIAKDGNVVVADAMVVLLEGRPDYPQLEPMFLNFNNLKWKNRPLYQYNFYVMGQVCVRKGYRGKGIFEMLYQKHKEIYQPLFDFLVTEISTKNHRSIRAHEKVGFKQISTYSDALDEWAVVLWDWTQGK